MTVFDFDSYKDYLKKAIADHKTERAFQRRVAEAAGCQPSYLSQALNGKVQIIPDQALGIADFLNLTEEETEYFLALVLLDRAVKPSFKSFMSKKIAFLKKRHFHLTEKIKEKNSPSYLDAFAHTYYSQWYFMAIHLLCLNPKVKNEADICMRLGLKRETVVNVLSQLKENGLLEVKGGAWRATLQNVHLAYNHQMISRHHTNWRFRAASQAHPLGEGQMQYTGVYSISEEDRKKIYNLLSDQIVSVRKIALKSADDELVNLNIDFLKI